MQSITARKIKLIGHIIRNNDFIIKIFEGKIQENKSRERPRKRYFKVLQDLMNYGSYHEMKVIAKDREEWLFRQDLIFKI